MKSIPNILALAAVAAAVAIPAEANAQVSVVGEFVMERESGPGERYSGTIVLRNSSGEPQEAKLYQTDYLSFADGRAAYREPGTTPRSNAGWIALTPSYVTIPPRETMRVTYTVTVPDGAAGVLVGTYWSMVMVEGIAQGSAESARRAPAGEQVQIGIRAKVRYALQIVTHIANSGSRKAQFAETKVVSGRDGSRVLQFDVVNAGERAYSPEISVELYDQSGRVAGRFRQTHVLTYPGTSLRQTFDLSKLPAGRYKALALVDAGADEVFGAQFTLTF